jgi:CCR4-NOT transcription complex subunit 9
VATFIIQKILLDEMGLNYICATFERFSAVRRPFEPRWRLLAGAKPIQQRTDVRLVLVGSQVSTVLTNMVAALAETPSQRLLKHIIRCYLRLADNPRFVSR